ncbi:dTDP-4-dehydrorhamnose 3,5-epimerase [Algiphilus sp.]|uniref:dTDP-4-dehydrorhamnose 3,5-epimerase n=1 Tax=Algiphilus sp. TaxID=1872431 RepID=UPI003B517CDE
MTPRKTALNEVLILEPTVFGDARGYFMEAFNRRQFEAAAGHPGAFVQDNQSRSRKGVLRGLHYQIGAHPQGKLVRVLAGEIFDVAVDIRRASATFGQWTGVLLSAENRYQLWVPPGFAHGFLVTSESAEVLYKVTDWYDPDGERSVRWDDPDIGIDWPLEAEPILAAKDRDGCLLRDAETF